MICILCYGPPVLRAFHTAGGSWDPREEAFIVRRREVEGFGMS